MYQNEEQSYVSDTVLDDICLILNGGFSETSLNVIYALTNLSKCMCHKTFSSTFGNVRSRQVYLYDSLELRSRDR